MTFSKKTNASKTLENTLVFFGPLLIELGTELLGILPQTVYGKIIAVLVGMGLYSLKNWLKNR